MSYAARLMLALSTLCFAGCATSQVITNDPNAGIWANGRLIGHGQGEIDHFGMPETTLVQVRTSDGRGHDIVVKRHVTGFTALTGVLTYGICFLLCWDDRRLSPATTDLPGTGAATAGRRAHSARSVPAPAARGVPADAARGVPAHGPLSQMNPGLRSASTLVSKIRAVNPAIAGLSSGPRIRPMFTCARCTPVSHVHLARARPASRSCHRAES